ncbi:MAG TPA: T9SS type A sorting domain-containing protein [Hymenobacter sp.]|uniref:T9SS type A sorting domain-containing protein n=1 Tax=Hymenobacter sp. TaxID=1898978 RepID=UPI002D804C9C|nr:T9SS type A sorting domain-containing protein [Hymenobacter sp.]HET9502301.1 T9SS type A sorting domain-containing protein [Hymenobacter sp.]
MKITLRSIWSLVLLLAASATALAQSPTWRAVTAINNTNAVYSRVRAVAADGNGNLYVVGSYSGTIVLGALSLSHTAGLNTFVAKWNIATSAYVWAQACGGVANTLTVSGPNVYIGGVVWAGSASFGPYTASNTGNNAFVAKLTDNGSSGSFAWVQQLGGESFAGVQALAVAGSSVYATGAFNSGTASFGSYTLTNATPGYTTAGELYVAKLTDASTSASVAWAQQVAAGQTGKQGYPRGLAVSGSSVYVTGFPAFVAKFSDAGSFAWSKPVGGAQVYPASLAARGSDIYVTGRFTGATATFGATTLAQTTGSPTFSGDVFVAKLTDAGTAATDGWALQAGGTRNDSTTAIVASSSGLYVAGSFSSPTASFGATTVANASTSTNFFNGYSAFAARIVETATGASFARALPAGGAGGARATSLAASGSSLYVVGSLEGTNASFGSLTVLGNVNSGAGFLAEIGGAALATRAVSALAEDALYPNPAAHGAAMVRVPVAKGTATLTLLDALGRVVRTQPATPGTECQLNLAGLRAGAYLVRVQAGDLLAVRQLLVE